MQYYDKEIFSAAWLVMNCSSPKTGMNPVPSSQAAGNNGGTCPSLSYSFLNPGVVQFRFAEPQEVVSTASPFYIYCCTEKYGKSKD